MAVSSLEASLQRPPRRRRWAILPTPVERAPWLDGPSHEVWIKRDDRSSSVYGGGKVRKLEWVLANPPFDGPEPIVSVGGIGSHHLLALALFLAEDGRMLHGLTFTQTLTEHVRRNLAVLLSSGAELWHVEHRRGLPWAWLAYHVWRRPTTMGRGMAAGASTALGCFGFVEAGFELAAQIEAGTCPRPSTVFVTAGSAGTCAGLAIGLALAGIGTHLQLVSSVERWAFNELLFRRKLAQAWAELRRHGLPAADQRLGTVLERVGVSWSIDHREVGGGYGVPTEACERAIALARDHGLGLEATYTGKCIAGLQAAIATAALRPGPVLFWNTHAANDLEPRIVAGWEARAPASLVDRLR